MAKTYYSIEEAIEKLGVSEDDIKSLVRDGRLREFRDAGKVHYRVDEIDKLASPAPEPPSGGSSLPGLDLGGGGDDVEELMLEPVEEAPKEEEPKKEAPPKEKEPEAAGLSGSSLPLADSGAEGSDSGLISLEDSDGAPADEITLDDSTAPSGNRKDDTVITGAGISVFDDEDLEVEADPMAKTVLTASASDQVALEGIGSGSGLLDLSREADDTSLGAELLDEIYPGQEETRVDSEAEEHDEAAATAGMAEPEEVAAVGVLRQVEVIDDPYAPAFTSAMVVAALMLALAGAVTAAFVRGVWPDYLQTVYSNFWAFFGGSYGLFVVVLGVTYFVCRSKARR